MLSNNIKSTSSNNSSNKSCHNCRRQRLRCDRSWPTCNKCFVSKQECQGYGKVYVWTQQGIDSRGKVKLKPAPGARRAAVCEDHGVAGHHVPHHHQHYQQQLQHQRQHQRQHQHQHLRPTKIDVVLGHTHANSVQSNSQVTDANAHANLATATAADVDGDTNANAHALMISGRQQPALDGTYTYPAPSQLIDPIFQDLDRCSRTYLAHFANRVCQDLVARDAPGRNPFRELIPLTRKHPLLLHILIATSALHWANSFSPLLTAAVALLNPDGGSGSSSSSSNESYNFTRLRYRDLVSRQAVIDALTAKQKAMAYLREVLESRPEPPPALAVSEVTLAAMHFFVKFDLIDLERDDAQSWKAHMAGASNVLALLTTATVSAQPQDDAGSRELRDCVVADCFIYHILGSTLAPGPWRAAYMTQHALELLPVLKRTEVNNYLSCPAEILQIIMSASQQSYDETLQRQDGRMATTKADKALALIKKALSFDIKGWAARLQQQTCEATDVESRIHVASAHRSAACLYILQALTPAATPMSAPQRAEAGMVADTRMLVDDILAHLAQVGEQDPYFKASSWPTFIAGAEARDAEARAWAMTRLLHIWKVCPWGYVLTAMEMLRASWRTQDAAGRAVGEGMNWLKGLQAMGFENLIV